MDEKKVIADGDAALASLEARADAMVQAVQATRVNLWRRYEVYLCLFIGFVMGAVVVRFFGMHH